MKKVVVFDLGGTIMEFSGMPLNWSSYYISGFKNVNYYFGLRLSGADIQKSAEVLEGYNPRVNYRENEISPEVIFNDAVKHWKKEINIKQVIDVFFQGLQLNAVVFGYSIKILEKCKKEGYIIACLTDLPNGMPDEIFRPSISQIESYLDLYVSSQICGVRKPNKYGLFYIADKFNISTSDILFVGDEEKDYLAAVNAGSSFIYTRDFVDIKLPGWYSGQ